MAPYGAGTIIIYPSSLKQRVVEDLLLLLDENIHGIQFSYLAKYGKIHGIEYGRILIVNFIQIYDTIERFVKKF